MGVIRGWAMSFVKTVPVGEAQGLLREQYERFAKSLGLAEPPNLTKAWSLQPEIAKAWLDFGHLAMDRSGLSNKEIELMLTRITHRLKCAYVTRNHAWILWRITGWTKRRVIDVVRKRDWSGLSNREKRLVRLADKICARSHRTNRRDIEGLRRSGLTEAQITAALFLIGWLVSDAVIPNTLGPAPDGFSQDFSSAVDW